MLHQRRQAPADAHVEPHLRIRGVGRVHVVPLFVGHHLERQLVVVAQEQRPLAVGRNLRRLAHDFDDRQRVLLPDRHEDARHQREVIRHVAFVTVAEVRTDIGRPLIRLRQQRAIGKALVHGLAQLLQDVVRLLEVLAVGSLALDEIRDGVEPQPVHTHVEPELHHVGHRLQHARILEVEIGLMAEEAVPVVLLGDRIPCPVRRLGIGEDDARGRVVVARVTPHVVVALGRALRRLPRRLEPRVLIGRVVDDQFGEDAQPACVRFLEQHLEVAQRPVRRVDVAIVGDVVAVVAQRRRIERQQPDRVDAEVLNVIELLNQALEVADAVAVGIEEGADVQLVNERVFVPRGVGRHGSRHRLGGPGGRGVSDDRA